MTMLSLSHSRARLRLALAGLLYLLSRPLGLQRRHHGKTRVLVFHHLDRPERLAAILTTLSARYQLISFADYCAGRIATDRINLILSCDDGYASWHQNGLPLFTRFGIRPLLFVCSGFIGLEKAAAFEFCQSRISTWPEAALSWPQLRELASTGAEIGGHSAQHLNLRTVTPATAAADLQADRQELATQLGAAPQCFAYPFGIYNAQTTQLVAQAGYTYAFTSDSGWLGDSASPLLLNRSNVGLKPLWQICAEVEGWGDTVSRLIGFLKGRSTWSAT